MADLASQVLLLGSAELRKPLADRGFDVHNVRRIGQLTAPIADLAPRAIVLGGRSLPAIRWFETIPLIRQTWPLVDIVAWGPHASPASVRDALKSGVREFVLDRSPKIVSGHVARIVSEQQLLPRTTQDAQTSGQVEFEGMLSRSQRMHDLFETAAQVSQSAAAVLILGETGTGKELLARAIHKRSLRPGRFVAINCAAVPETLIDSELFGHVEGAFTGASKAKDGLFRHAHEGTLLLDEAGNVPLPVQYRLLRVLQENAVRPVGGHSEIPVDVRVIAATSANLEDDVVAGHFREDLFYRLDVVRLVVPPLRERPDDVIYLFAQFAKRFADDYRVDRPDVSDGFLDALIAYPWPGNVRQLQNFTERVVLTETGKLVTAERFHQLAAFQDAGSAPVARQAVVQLDPDKPAAVDHDVDMETALRPHVEALERTYLEGVLTQTRGRVAEAANHAGISRRTLSRMMRRLGINKARFKEG